MSGIAEVEWHRAAAARWRFRRDDLLTAADRFGDLQRRRRLDPRADQSASSGVAARTTEAVLEPVELDRNEREAERLVLARLDARVAVADHRGDRIMPTTIWLRCTGDSPVEIGDRGVELGSPRLDDTGSRAAS